jgi:hypothetical protein
MGPHQAVHFCDGCRDGFIARTVVMKNAHCGEERLVIRRAGNPTLVESNICQVESEPLSDRSSCGYHLLWFCPRHLA